MDLIFKRYSSPFLIIDQMITFGRFEDFVLESFEKNEDDKLWEIYLHSMSGQSFSEFKNDVMIQNTPINKSDLEATITDSVTMLEGFSPFSTGK